MVKTKKQRLKLNFHTVERKKGIDTAEMPEIQNSERNILREIYLTLPVMIIYQ